MNLRIRVPATTANLGPGFDTLGMALNIFNTVEAEYIESEKSSLDHKIIYEDEILQVEHDITEVAFNIVSEIYNTEDDVNTTKYRCVVRSYVTIPMARGLGSSTAAFCAGALVALYMFVPDVVCDAMGNICDDALLTIFQLCSKYDGHSDNAVACVYGGFQAYAPGVEAEHIELKYSDRIRMGVIVPSYQCSTQESRKSLPLHNNRQVTVQQLQSITTVIAGIQRGSVKMLRTAFENDLLHVPYRRPLNPCLRDVESLISNNELDAAVTLSGSGSTLFVVASCDETINEIFSNLKTKNCTPADSKEYEVTTYLVNGAYGITCTVS